MSNSFADECFAKLANEFGVEQLKEKTVFKNTPPSVRTIILSRISESGVVDFYWTILIISFQD
jgi:hypothetical protein